MMTKGNSMGSGPRNAPERRGVRRKKTPRNSEKSTLAGPVDTVSGAQHRILITRKALFHRLHHRIIPLDLDDVPVSHRERIARAGDVGTILTRPGHDILRDD